jgi:hypothetical protein
MIFPRVRSFDGLQDSWAAALKRELELNYWIRKRHVIVIWIYAAATAAYARYILTRREPE